MSRQTSNIFESSLPSRLILRHSTQLPPSRSHHRHPARPMSVQNRVDFPASEGSPTPIPTIDDTQSFTEKWSVHLPRRLLILPPTALLLGAFIGVSRGGTRARLRFLAENAHRQPTTVQGWVSFSDSCCREDVNPLRAIVLLHQDTELSDTLRFLEGRSKNRAYPRSSNGALRLVGRRRAFSAEYIRPDAGDIVRWSTIRRTS